MRYSLRNSFIRILQVFLVTEVLVLGQEKEAEESALDAKKRRRLGMAAESKIAADFSMQDCHSCANS